VKNHRFKPSQRSYRKPTARLHLPHLAPDDALLVVSVLERAIDAIWRTHGNEMVHAYFESAATAPRRSTAQLTMPLNDSDTAF
jgi:hypothetical protein